MKRLFLLLSIILATNVINAQETYRFRTNHPQGFSIESSTASGLSLHYALDEITVGNYNNGSANGQEIIMKGSFGSFAEGLPSLPFVNRYIAVPRGAQVNIKVKENGHQILNDIELLPAAKVKLNREAGLPELHKNMSVFGKDANFPSENVTVAQTIQIRGLDIVMLNVTPFRYNPVQKTLEVIYDMDIEVTFEGGNGQFGEARYRNPAWDGILHDLVINSEMLPEVHYYDLINEAIRNKEEGCEYLIISPDDPAILAWADTLKQFRMRQGILTKVVTITDCGSNEPEDIRNYIVNAYENWAIPPAAVLLFAENHYGAPEFGIKPFLFTSPQSYGYTYLYPSDNPFADINGDSIPDLAVSRIVAKYPSEYQQQVKKLIDYELNPPTDPHYYDHPVITSGYQEDKWFMITSQIINNFFCDKLGKHTTNNYMVFDQMNPEPTPPDSIWSTGFNTNAVLDYYGPNGTNYIPLSIEGLNHWGYMNDIQALIDAMSEGGFFTLYRDHSDEDTWCCPWFENKYIPLLQNESPTFIFSIGCLTNNFWDNWTTCLSETFLHAPVGAIGVIGANTVTYSHYNDLITWGMFDHFWPNFMPTLGCQTEPDFSYPSYALVAGKLFLRQQTFLPYDTDTIKVEKTLNLFSYLGETYLNFYTEVPQHLSVEAPLFHANNQWQYTYTAEVGTTICLSNEDGILAVARATGEPQSLIIPQMEVGEQFTLTATKQNRFRHEQTITIISAQQPYIYLRDINLRDLSGNGQLDYGEYADIDITIGNATTLASEGNQATLHCDSPYIEILQGVASYPHLNPDSVITIEKAFRIKLANNVPDQTSIVFRVHFNEGENTHDDYFTITANAPLIQIEPEFRLMTSEGKPATHISTEGKSHITFTINNIGHSTAEYLYANFNVKAPFVSVAPTQPHERLEPNEHRDITFELTAQPNTVTGAWLQAHLDVQFGEQHAYFDTIVQYGGIFENFETDTLNPSFLWNMSSGNHKWIYSEEDAYEGNRCFVSQSDTINASRLIVKWEIPHVAHDSKISFHYKTDINGTLVYSYSLSTNDAIQLISDEWQYAEILYSGTPGFIWRYYLSDNQGTQARLDDICFPPTHTTIAYAGSDIVVCEETQITLFEAYAYDCNSILWTTSGDGHFNYDTIANPTYFPGSQDLANGIVVLTLSAFGNDTVISSTQIRFVDEISLTPIVGDSVVNKYTNPVSHYAVEPQEGINYLWQLEPAEAGAIYNYRNEIDILWDLNVGDADVTLSVTTDNGCEAEPVTKAISLIGYSTPELQSVYFDLYPNPTDGKVNLVLGDNLRGKTLIEVYNLLGERMMVRTLHHLQKGEAVSLDLSNLVSGLYVIKLSTENGSCSKKVSIR